MIDNGFWQVFTDTGDPMCYLMYVNERKRDEERNRRLKPQDEKPPPPEEMSSSSF